MADLPLAAAKLSLTGHGPASKLLRQDPMP
jgi:hypothetical protein